jgi:hypothetical protein
MKLKITLGLFTLAVVALLWAPSAVAATPGLQAPEAPAPEASVLEPSAVPTVAAEACNAAPGFGPVNVLEWMGFDPPCDPSYCNKICLIQGYDFGVCAGSACSCRWYV